MCYAGGPRCYADAKKDYDTAFQRLQDFKKKHGSEEEILATGFGVLKEYRTLKLDVRDKRIDVQQTKQYVEDLAESIDGGSVSGNLEESASQTLLEAKAGYDNQMLAYDQRNNTVLGRKPSRYGTNEGIRFLAQKVRAAEQQSPEKAAYALKEYEHAVVTRERVKNGDITLPADYEPWDEKPEANGLYQSMDTHHLKSELRFVEHQKNLHLRGIQQMMIDNAKNPYSQRHRMNLAVKEAEIADVEQKIQDISHALTSKNNVN